VFALTIGVAFLVCGATIPVSAQKNGKTPDAGRPKFTVKAQPAYGVSPAHITLTAELVGGADDFEEYYCPTVRWEWDDGTSSESTLDCAPFEAGKTEIKRKFLIEHTFKQAGAFKVYVRLKQKNKEVATASALVQIQPGAGDFRP